MADIIGEISTPHGDRRLVFDRTHWYPLGPNGRRKRGHGLSWREAELVRLLAEVRDELKRRENQ